MRCFESISIQAENKHKELCEKCGKVVELDLSLCQVQLTSKVMLLSCE